MGKKHYERIAAIINQKMLDSVVVDLAYALADYFSEDNPKFDRPHFLKACGL